MLQSLFAELKICYSNHRAIYTDGSKTENKVAAAATSNNLSASIFTAELQALKMAFNIVKNCDGIILFYLLTPYLVLKLLIATTVITLLYKIY